MILQARSNVVYCNGGCQISSLVMRGRLDLSYLWVLHVTGFSAAVGFHLVLVSTQLENQFLYFSLNKAFLLKLVIASNRLVFTLLIIAIFNRGLNRKYPIGYNIPNWVFQIPDWGYFIQFGIADLFSDFALPDSEISNLEYYPKMEILYLQIGIICLIGVFSVSSLMPY